MGVKAKTISDFNDLELELSQPIKGLTVVVLSMPGREENAELLREIYAKILSM